MTSSRRAGFTLIELLIFAAIFSFVVVSFITIYLTVTNIQLRESSQAEVNGQSQFLLQQVQYYVERSSLVDMPADAPTSTLKLYLGVNSQDPMFMTLASGTVYLQQTATGTLQALTSNKVAVSNLTFTRHANPPGHDSVGVAFSMAFNTTNLGQIFSQALQTSVTRVSAATFDSNLVPSSTATYNVGVSGQTWSSINQVINFSGSNVGIGVSPIAPLEVAGGNVRVDNGDIAVVSNTNGIILKDPSNVCWRIKVNASGTLVTASVGCP
jgi:type II secretory pathway pseudopilin PulG